MALVSREKVQRDWLSYGATIAEFDVFNDGIQTIVAEAPQPFEPTPVKKNGRNIINIPRKRRKERDLPLPLNLNLSFYQPLLLNLSLHYPLYLSQYMKLK